MLLSAAVAQEGWAASSVPRWTSGWCQWDHRASTVGSAGWKVTLCTKWVAECNFLSPAVRTNSRAQPSQRLCEPGRHSTTSFPPAAGHSRRPGACSQQKDTHSPPCSAQACCWASQLPSPPAAANNLSSSQREAPGTSNRSFRLKQQPPTQCTRLTPEEALLPDSGLVTQQTMSTGCSGES